jgi:hypothetical protein
MFAFRNHLLRQSNLDMSQKQLQRGDLLTSGSVPVQHRLPRPVPLPENKQPMQALQTWASRFEPGQNILVTPSPADEAFFAACGSQLRRRVQMVMVEPANGVIPPEWDGAVVFQITTGEDRPNVVELFDLTLTQNGKSNPYVYEPEAFWLFTLGAEAFEEELNNEEIPEPLRTEFEDQGRALSDEASVTTVTLPGGTTIWRLVDQNDYYTIIKQTITINTKKTEKLIVYHRDDLFKFRFVLQPSPGGLIDDETTTVTTTPGQSLVVKAAVFYRLDNDNKREGFKQILSFPLRPAEPKKLPLPLAPRFIHFEDPEYNRRLASAAASASRQVPVSRLTTETPKAPYETFLFTATLATDRQAYNPDSELALRYDWAEEVDLPVEAEIRLARITPTGGAEDINIDLLILPGVLKTLNLGDYKDSDSGKLLFKPGDVLEIQLVLRGDLDKATIEGEAGPVRITETSVFLRVDIVEDPVIPAPEAGYALLHRQQIGHQMQVECARFAWKPAATRVELVCPEDLKTEIVRRRAVFHWLHTVRPGRSSLHVIQKITPNGSTHFPVLDNGSDAD